MDPPTYRRTQQSIIACYAFRNRFSFTMTFLCYDKIMKNKAQEIQNEIYRKMSSDRKIKILDDFFKFARVLKQNDNKKAFKRNKFSSRATQY